MITSKKELINKISNATNFTKKDINEMYEGLVAVIKNEASSSDTTNIILPGIGKFVVKIQEARTCKNPSNGETVEIPSRKRAYFRVFPSFSKEMNE